MRSGALITVLPQEYPSPPTLGKEGCLYSYLDQRLPHAQSSTSWLQCQPVELIQNVDMVFRYAQCGHEEVLKAGSPRVVMPASRLIDLQTPNGLKRITQTKCHPHNPSD